MFGWFRTLTKKVQLSELDTAASASPAQSPAPAPEAWSPEPGAAPARDATEAVRADTAAVEHVLDSTANRVEAPTFPAVPAPPTNHGPAPAGAGHPSVRANETPELADRSTTAPAVGVQSVDAVGAESPVSGSPAASRGTGIPETETPEADPASALRTGAEAERDDETESGLVAAPSGRPAMPLSAHPNFAGLGLAEWTPTTPRLLEPTAALGPEAQRELLALFDDLFGPTGRYRLEWRVDRRQSDDAMFADIMVADLVRRVQNTLGELADAELEAAPVRAAIEASPDNTDESTDELRQAS